MFLPAYRSSSPYTDLSSSTLSVSYAHCISPWYSCYAPSSSCIVFLSCAQLNIHVLPVLPTVPLHGLPVLLRVPLCGLLDMQLQIHWHWQRSTVIFTTFLSCSQAVPLVFLFFSFSPRLFRIQGAHGLIVSLTIPTLFLVPLHILAGEQFLSMAAGLPGLSPPSLPTLLYSFFHQRADCKSSTLTFYLRLYHLRLSIPCDTSTSKVTM